MLVKVRVRITYLIRIEESFLKILVTGGGGFIGRHLVKALAASEENIITVLDNFSTSSESDFRDLKDQKNVELVKWNVTSPFSFDCEVIFNLACPASPVQYQKNPVETSRTNFLGTLHALTLAREKKAVMVQASTSEVYGDPKFSPQVESYWGNVNPIGIRSCYDEGKRVAETLCFDFYREYNTTIKVARIFNTYGPGMAFNDGRVVSNFIVQALEDEDISIYGRGEQTRSFCYVRDIVKGLMSLAFTPTETTGPINIGNPNEITISTLAKEILALTNSKSAITYHQLPADDPVQRKPEISMASKILGWKPEVDLHSGLGLTISDFRNRLKDVK
jgi:UDP-glucuronate decarboxylase